MQIPLIFSGLVPSHQMLGADEGDSVTTAEVFPQQSNNPPAIPPAFSKQPSLRVAVLDLAEVRTIDAADAGALVSLRKRATANGVALKLVNLTLRVEELLELTRLRSAFEVSSVPEMLGLLCSAFEQSQFVGIDAALETSVEGRGHSEPVLAETA